MCIIWLCLLVKNFVDSFRSNSSFAVTLFMSVSSECTCVATATCPFTRQHSTYYTSVSAEIAPGGARRSGVEYVAMDLWLAPLSDTTSGIVFKVRQRYSLIDVLQNANCLLVN